MSEHEALLVVIVTIISIAVMVGTCVWAQWAMARTVKQYAESLRAHNSPTTPMNGGPDE